MTSEDHNLRIFKILYIIKGILTLVFSIIPLLYIFFGIYLFQFHDKHDDDSTIGGAIVMTIGIVLFLFFVAMGILTLLTAKYLGEKRNYDFVFVMAIINCLTGILGIILGIFTIIELNKTNVKRLFGKPV
ncbi:hypothetical protein [Christiangramia echinicola]|uniref:Uncharacterized protein n=1 Tax=Christiangramia echinicola TaxID=279359 RepID=A0A1H1KWI1_9FLAO|nr:hypothetical protein [Christiangramia echinicola]SDR66400.1 hypothetical protein SAMN04488552_0280 [Christiangramia echinicola]